MSKEKTTKTCSNCGAEMPANAKECSSCGKNFNKPFYKKPWFIIIVVLLVIGLIGSIGGSGTSKSKNNSAGSNETKSEKTIEYQACDVGTMMSELDANAASAKDKYNDQYVSITGRLSNIDSDCAYIDVVDQNDEWAIIGVQCYTKNNDEVIAKVKQLSKDQIITVKGKIFNVGEVIGYSLNIDSIE